MDRKNDHPGSDAINNAGVIEPVVAVVEVVKSVADFDLGGDRHALAVEVEAHIFAPLPTIGLHDDLICMAQ